MSTQEKNSSEKKEHAAGGKQEQSSVSQLLSQLRKEKGLSLQDIAGQTNISVSNLVSIENEAYDALPADTFIRGQIAIYADVLGIDGPETAKRFLVERHKHQQKMGRTDLSGRDQGNMSANKLSEPSYFSSATLAAFLFLLIVVAVAAFSLATGWNPFGGLKREQQPAVPLTSASSSQSPPAAAPENGAEETSPAESEEQAQTSPQPENSSAAAGSESGAAGTVTTESSQQ